MEESTHSPEKVGRIWRIILNSRNFHRAFSFSFFTRIQKRIYFRLKSFTHEFPGTNFGAILLVEKKHCLGLFSMDIAGHG